MFFRHLLLMLRMVRSPFLLASALACLLGWACAYLGGSPWQLGSALASLFLAMALHAAAKRHTGTRPAGDVAVFAALRQWKDGFRA